MNKLQQEIIKIIEPYMNKTLGKGCLIKHLKTKQLIEIVQERPLDFYCKSNDLFKDIAKICIGDKSINKILGHYDITAVLKYMEDNTFHEMFMHKDIIIFENNTGIGRFEIPNKPLYLYTEEENKDLLELLKELGQQ